MLCINWPYYADIYLLFFFTSCVIDLSKYNTLILVPRASHLPLSRTHGTHPNTILRLTNQGARQTLSTGLLYTNICFTPPDIVLVFARDFFLISQKRLLDFYMSFIGIFVSRAFFRTYIILVLAMTSNRPGALTITSTYSQWLYRNLCSLEQVSIRVDTITSNKSAFPAMDNCYTSIRKREPFPCCFLDGRRFASFAKLHGF